MSKSFEQVGLPRGHGFSVLAYHIPTQSIIVLTQPTEGNPVGKRLSIRKVDEESYKEIADLPDNISVESFCLSQRLPLLYFITYSWQKTEEEGLGGDWEALHRFDMSAKKHEVLARRGELHAPGQYSRAWISDILAVDDDGHVLHVVSAIERAGGKMHLRGQEIDLLSHVEHHISSLNLSGLLLTPISQLEATFA